ncbi:MAG: DUF2975 domain-containing protein [Candidatus Synoicihabitans palmerolidicus]|nr:DUF2975 domain-containing protein [Candidatus Synoicihabitans palmerolidicus]
MLILSAIAFTVGTSYLAFLTFAPERSLPEHKVYIHSGPISDKFIDARGNSIPVKFDKIQGEFILPPGHRIHRIYDTGMRLIALILVTAILSQLRQLLKSVRNAHPFIAVNARRLNRIAWFALLGTVGQLIYHIFLALLVSHSLPALDFSLRLEFKVTPFLTVLAIFIIAEVFNLEVKMQEEQDLTV